MDSEPCGSSETTANTQTTIRRKELFLHLQEHGFLASKPSQCCDCIFDYIIDKSPVLKQDLDIVELKRKIKVFVNSVLKKYRKFHRSHKNVLKKYVVWFNQPFIIPMHHQEGSSSASKPRRRPKKLFAEGSKRTKSWQVCELTTKDSSQLLFAAQRTLRLDRKRAASKVIEIASNATPKSLKRMHDSALKPTTEVEKYTPNEALALMIDCNLTKDTYVTMQRGAKVRGCDIYPSYKAIQAAKLKCYPENDFIITEDGAEVSLQGLLDFTLERLVSVYSEVFCRVQTGLVQFTFKWGFDGSGGHSVYKQHFSDSRLYGDTNIILCSVVPIQISTDDITFWKASSTSSTRFCRPLIFRLLKETSENVINLYKDVNSQIENLQPKVKIIEGKTITFQYIMLPTMFDGKIINIITGNRSTQNCYIYKAKASDMNKIEVIKNKSCDIRTYKYGISILHAYIRTMELLLHVCYKIDLKKWQARGEAEKRLVKEKQQTITSRFYNEMGLVIDLPKQGGGNSKNGNNSRRFFSSPDQVAHITGLDKHLIYRFSVILSTLASGYSINKDTFRNYSYETAAMYSQTYNWYYMSVTVHKVLLHGADIIASLPLPVGMLSEDIQESRQKDFKNFRLFHTRKTSRLNTNTDIFHMLLITSDPVINSFRKKPKKKSIPFNEDVTSFFECPDIPTHEDILDEDDDDDEVMD